MAKYLYDVFDLEGNAIITGMTTDEIGEALEVAPNYVSKCEIEGKKLKGKYKIFKSEEVCSKANVASKILQEKWDEARKPFLNVEWVKEMGPGVKSLIRRA